MPEASACIDGHRKIALDADHLKMNKFYGLNDPSFKLVYSQIVAMAKDADKTLHRRRNPQALPIDERSTSGSLQECLRDMRVSNPLDVLAQVQDQKGRRVGSTCEWILEREEFTRWAMSDTAQLLRLIGSPGIGKTMMSTFLFEKLKAKVEKAPEKAFVYFFCDDKDQSRKTPTAILRSLVWQLLLQRNKLFQPHVQPDFEKHEDNYVFKNLFNDFYPLWRIFNAMLQDEQTGEVFILIDALDECERTTRQTLLRAIARLFQPLPTATAGKFKFFITCRPDIDDIEDELRGVGEALRMDSALINDDLSEYIDTKVDELAKRKDYSSPIKTKVQEALKREAGGTFLWVSLMVTELSRPHVRKLQVETMLQNLPHGLEETYSAILDQVPTENREPAQFILRCMAAAYRPLTKSEIQAAYATWKTGLLKRGEDLELYSDILSVCSSILFVGSDGDETLNFCHQSVKDFLLQQTSAATAWYHSTNSEAHLQIFRACWAYLSVDEFDGGRLVVPYGDDNEIKKSIRLMNQFPRHSFLEYASDEWKNHAIASHEASLHKWHDLPIDVAQVPPLRDSWLLCAVEERQVAVAKLLLENGANIEARTMDKETPILLATRHGCEDVIKLLLENGADITAKDQHGHTPVYRAVRYGHEAVVRLLLENSKDAEAKRVECQALILYAVTTGQEAVVKLLLENGTDIEAKDGAGNTPILASRMGL